MAFLPTACEQKYPPLAEILDLDLDANRMSYHLYLVIVLPGSGTEAEIYFFPAQASLINLCGFIFGSGEFST